MDEFQKGKLYLCATPIGNLEDMPVRAIRLMKEADVIAAEDTRNSIKLINHFQIDTPMTAIMNLINMTKPEHLLTGC